MFVQFEYWANRDETPIYLGGFDCDNLHWLGLYLEVIPDGVRGFLDWMERLRGVRGLASWVPPLSGYHHGDAVVRCVDWGSGRGKDKDTQGVWVNAAYPTAPWLRLAKPPEMAPAASQWGTVPLTYGGSWQDRQGAVVELLGPADGGAKVEVKTSNGVTRKIWAERFVEEYNPWIL